MSKFNKYIKEAEKVARLAIAKYIVAETEFDAAKRKMDDMPTSQNLADPIYQAKATIAKGEWLEAQAKFDSLRRNLPGEVESKLNEIRRELEADLTDSFAASPDQIDSNMLELLKGGILRPSEYVQMIDKAASEENFTMARLIGKYAQDALETEVARNGNGRAASMLRLAIDKSRRTGADGYLDKFDTLTYTARRCIENPGMQAHWDRLMGDLIKEF